MSVCKNCAYDYVCECIEDCEIHTGKSYFEILEEAKTKKKQKYLNALYDYEALKKAIRNKATIILTDYSENVWGEDNGYIYTTKWVHNKTTTKYDQYQSTSSDFAYCGICASFTESCGCGESDRESFYHEELIIYLEWIYLQRPKDIEVEILYKPGEIEIMKEEAKKGE